MGLKSAIAGFAAGAPIPVFAVAGFGMRAAVQDLRLARGIQLVDSPRAAAILLIAGDVDDEHREALGRTQALLPHPRASVAWQGRDPFAGRPGVGTTKVTEDDPGPALRQVFLDLLGGRRPSELPVPPDEDPVDWRGVGPYGQGGSGMTGGTPYGRPMAELGPDRDGLRLDILPTELGPFFPRLPTGLVLELKLAGDLVTEAAVLAARAGSAPAGHLSDVSPFVRALAEPVSIAELEHARARDHLRWLADALVAQGLDALGLRALRLARYARPGDSARIRALGRWVGRTGVYRWSLPRGSRVDRTTISGLGLGPLARAAGQAEDVRVDDPGYRALGFTPWTIDRSEAAGWWQVRVEEAARSLELAARAGTATTEIVGRVESPRGRLEHGDSPTGRALAMVAELVSGLEWGDAVSTLVALDLDLEEAAAVAPPAALRAIA